MKHCSFIVLILVFAITLSGCFGTFDGKNDFKRECANLSYTQDSVNNDTKEELENICKKNLIGSFQNSFSMEGRKIFMESMVQADFSKVYKDIESLYYAAENIVYGTVQNVQYTDDDAAPRTIYTFDVADSLKGSIPADSLISISESNGYVRLQTFIDVYGKDHFEDVSDEEIENGVIMQSVAGAPLPEIGEKYVVFLSEKQEDGRIAGAYVVIGNFMGKYVLNATTQLFERYQPADDGNFYSIKDSTTRTMVHEEPMSLEDIKDAVSKLEQTA